MTATRFTRSTIPALTCRAGVPKVFYWDAALPGFGVCVRASGLRTWVCQYRTSDGNSKRITLGDARVVSLDEARKAAQQHLSRAKLGHDPQGEKTAARRAVRLGDLVEEYLAVTREKHRARYRSEVERHLRTQARPLHNIAAATITRGDIHSLLQNVQLSSGPVAANRLRASLSSLFTWALRAGRIEAHENPVAWVPRPAQERSRERVLSDDDLRLIWVCTAGGSMFERVVRMLLLTGARRDEVSGMHWEELEIDPSNFTGRWVLPQERSKNSQKHVVPLGALCLTQLPAQRAHSRSVFGEIGTGFSGWSKGKSQLDKRLTTHCTAAGVNPPRHWTLHDLRRTLSTWLSEHGVEPHVVEALLNHVSGNARRGVAGVYNRAAYTEQKKAALTIWENHIREITSTCSRERSFAPAY